MLEPSTSPPMPLPLPLVLPLPAGHDADPPEADAAVVSEVPDPEASVVSEVSEALGSRRLRARRPAGRGGAAAVVADVAHPGAVVVATGTYHERQRDESCEESMTEHVPLLRWICRLVEGDPTASVRGRYQSVVGEV